MFRALHFIESDTRSAPLTEAEGAGIVTTRAAVGVWTPTNEAAQGIASALRAHWAEAKKVAATSPFFRRSANWLEVSRRHLAGGDWPRSAPQLARATSHAAPVSAATSDVTGMKRPE